MSHPCLAYHGGVLFDDDDRNMQRVQQMVTLRFVLYQLGAFFQTVCHGISTQNIRGCIRRRAKGQVL